jgi:hypothetical protein
LTKEKIVGEVEPVGEVLTALSQECETEATFTRTPIKRRRSLSGKFPAVTGGAANVVLGIAGGIVGVAGGIVGGVAGVGGIAGAILLGGLLSGTEAVGVVTLRCLLKESDEYLSMWPAEGLLSGSVR